MTEPRSTLHITQTGVDPIDNKAELITISWEGGQPPFQLQKTKDFKTWENVWNPTMVQTRSFPNDGDMGFFRVQEAVPLLDIDLSYEPATRLVWKVPDLEEK